MRPWPWSSGVTGSTAGSRARSSWSASAGRFSSFATSSSGPKRFSEIQRGLPGIPTNILTARLNELEDNGLVRAARAGAAGEGRRLRTDRRRRGAGRCRCSRSDAGVRNILGEPRPDETITEDSIAMALRTTFRPEAAGKAKLTYLLKLGPIEVHARIRDGAVIVGRGPIAKPDLIIETGPALRALHGRTRFRPARRSRRGSCASRAIRSCSTASCGSSASNRARP